MILQKQGECEDFWDNACENLDEVEEQSCEQQWTEKLKKDITSKKTKISVATSSSFFFTREEEIRGSWTEDFLSLAKVLIQRMGIILNF